MRPQGVHSLLDLEGKSPFKTQTWDFWVAYLKQQHNITARGTSR
jgi:hypothetical protein